MTRRQSNIILGGIILSIVLAIILVAGWGAQAERGSPSWDNFQSFVGFADTMGQFFLRSLRMIVVPLVLASVIVGITGLGDVRKLGRLGGRTVAYYAMTTAIAVAIGMVVVLAIQPGVGVDHSGAAHSEEFKAKEASLSQAQQTGWRDIILSFVSTNIFTSLSNPDMLPIIVFALVFGGVLTTIGDKGKPVIAFFDGLNEAIMKMVHLIMWIAPLGIFGLVVGKFGRDVDQWAEILQSIGKYMAAVLIGLGIHALVVLPALCWLLARRSPIQFFGTMFPAILTAWSTASSSATLPLTLECAEERGGLSDKSTGFVLPLGATINMDGTALYESVAAIFIAQAYGIELSIMQMVMIFITATLASIGAAGIPEAGLFTMVIVLSAVNLPLEGVGLILTVDWFLDRFRTAINVWGDSVGAAYIDRVIKNSPDLAPAPA